jgi:hypothetical protein
MNYYIVPKDELYHHGVKGMKWGVRKKYISGRMANKRARDAGEKARKESIAADKASGKRMTFRQINKNANAARKEAYDKSKADDKAYNQKLRAERKKKAANFKQHRYEISLSRSKGAKLATNLLGGAFANRTYNSVLASGGSREKAKVVTAVTTMLGGPIGHLAVSNFYTREAARS